MHMLCNLWGSGSSNASTTLTGQMTTFLPSWLEAMKNHTGILRSFAGRPRFPNPSVDRWGCCRSRFIGRPPADREIVATARGRAAASRDIGPAHHWFKGRAGDRV